MKRTLLVGLIVGVMAMLVSAVYADEDVLPKDMPPIEYVSLCAGGTDAVIFSWHGINQDGKPPMDPDRRAVHFICEASAIFAPTDGVVWGSTGYYGGIILIYDAHHDACMVFLGLETQAVEDGDSVVAGTYLGQHRGRVHFTTLDGRCERANWYDWDARDLERPVQFQEMGYVIATDLRAPSAISFVSENPARLEDVFDGS